MCLLFQLPYRIRVDPRARGRARVPKNMHRVSTGVAFLLQCKKLASQEMIKVATAAVYGEADEETYQGPGIRPRLGSTGEVKNYY